MPLGRLALFLAIFVNHCPDARVEMSHDEPRKIKIIYNGPPFLELNPKQADILDDHHIGLYDGYAEIML